MLKKCVRQLFEVVNAQAAALTFSDVMPAGLPHAPGAQPSSCTFWRLAREGEAFYTETRDHFGCAVGAYVHGAELPDAQAQELSGLVSTMIGLSYIKPEEVAQLPRQTTPLRYAIYSPLDKCPALPDVVLVRGNARQLMLLTEAARAAGLLANSPTMGRPACSMIPESIASGRVVLSLGCIGNRIYTGLSEQEGYIAIPGSALESVCSQLSIIVAANETLARFHSERQAQFAAIGIT